MIQVWMRICTRTQILTFRCAFTFSSVLRPLHCDDLDCKPSWPAWPCPSQRNSRWSKILCQAFHPHPNLMQCAQIQSWWGGEGWGWGGGGGENTLAFSCMRFSGCQTDDFDSEQLWLSVKVLVHSSKWWGAWKTKDQRCHLCKPSINELRGCVSCLSAGFQDAFGCCLNLSTDKIVYSNNLYKLGSDPCKYQTWRTW